jgi:CspA family cold shock protein
MVGQTIKGVVKDFNSKRGFGYIATDQGKDRVFCHWKAIQTNDRWPKLDKGMKVQFELSLDEETGKMRALNVTQPGGGLITCTTDEKVYSEYCYPGKVKWFNAGQGEKSGYGFITIGMQANVGSEVVNDGDIIYVSREEILTEDTENPMVRRGMDVEFMLAQGKDGKISAADVTLPGRVVISTVRRGKK